MADTSSGSSVAFDGQILAESSKASSKTSVAFDVPLNDDPTDSKKKMSLPKRLQESRYNKPVTAVELVEKQQEADKRRKAYESAKLERMRQRQVECCQIQRAISTLMDQDAKRHNVDGTSHIKAMSGREAATLIRSVNTKLSRLNRQIDRDLTPP